MALGVMGLQSSVSDRADDSLVGGGGRWSTEMVRGMDRARAMRERGLSRKIGAVVTKRRMVEVDSMVERSMEVS